MLVKKETNWSQTRYQVCLVTDRKQVVFKTEAQQESILKYLTMILTQQACTLVESQVEPSYVLLKFDMDNTQNLTRVAKTIKSLSARYFLQEFPHLRNQKGRRALWSNQWFVQTLGQSDDTLIQTFINSQVKRKYRRKVGDENNATTNRG